MDLKIRQQRIKEAHWTSCLRYFVQILLRKTSDSRNKAEVLHILRLVGKYTEVFIKYFARIR